ncbi:uncharacterized protein YsxB (DUF464 family) [Mycoplasmoides fastidiosum]|uniref:Ribosomal processing cysteine protease Prp n=1 Tax=Mycoplasmoides fastidiosum TaxID=92758 RepID=A0ABU0LZH8_9BACT|nr:ribosomal-processing cysteine protease Prp [Mycoplasmoides fastidiosum]MDQ0514079.1 uncharacterized protein YsxB (DUF464 family) [Mycoplasmoides fastidiosum]UUD37511.1 ribosomal-processing cysteine protease Prp [Mycoplasmoides fastidiosum]
MIRIRINPAEISVQDHANFAVVNQDIVCAGVSAIILGACGFWINDQRIEIVQTVNPALVTIRFNSDALADSDLLSQKALLVKQLTMIAQNYPQYIQLEKHERNAND